MAKHSPKLEGGPLWQPTRPVRPSQKKHRPSGRMAIIVAGAVLVAYVASVYLVLPKELPALVQRSLGLVNAALALWVFALATGHRESHEELLLRLQHAHHADSGKDLRRPRRRRHTVTLPVLGQTSVRAIGGFVVFVVVGAWWLTPFAPVAVKKRVLEDLGVPLGQEIAAAVLVVPDRQLVTVQPPIVPPRARELARMIPLDADSRQLCLKAVAEGRFDDARRRLYAAMKTGDVPVIDIHVARAQTEMYAGQFGEAAAWYQNAVAIKPDDPMLLCQSAVAWIFAGSSRRAEPLVNEAVRIGRERSSEGDSILAFSLHVQALLDVVQGRHYDEAQRLNEEAYHVWTRTLGTEHPFVAASLNNQAALYLFQAKYAGSHELNQWTSEMWAKTLGPRHPNVAVSLGNLALLHMVLSEYSEARRLEEEATAIRRESLPPGHPMQGVSLNESAMLHLIGYQEADAQRLAEQAVAVLEKSLGAEHPAVAASLNTLAALYAQQSRYTKAEPYYLRAAAILKKAMGPRHPYLAMTLNNLAALYLMGGRYADAETQARQALEIAQAALGKQHPLVATTLTVLGRLALKRGQPHDARPYLERALSIREEALGKEHPDVASVLGDLASLENTSRTYRHGVSQYQRAIQMQENFLGATHPELARLLLGLAVLHIEQRNYAEAEPCLERAWEIRCKALVPFHPDLAATLEAYATVLRNKNPSESERAAAMAAQAKAVREKHSEEDRP